MTLHATMQAFGALGVSAAIAVGTLSVTKSTAQSAKQEAQSQAGSIAAPIYSITIPAGYLSLIHISEPTRRS